MNRSKIDWTDYSWNPVSGCLHTCPYCYARKQSFRFAGDVRLNMADPRCEHYNGNERLFVLHKPFITREDRSISYPFGFVPTLHEYRLDWPGKVKNGANIFVGSMTDLFGDWVPDEWIRLTFETCEKYPQHNYMFLTKNPERYVTLHAAGQLPSLPNMWYGTSVTDPSMPVFRSDSHRTFFSMEPLLAPFPDLLDEIFLHPPDWIIVGAETGNRKGKVTPERAWVENIVEACQVSGIPVFMKESLKDLMGDTFIQEFPKDLKRIVISPVQKKQLWDRCGFCKTEFRKKEMAALLSRENRGASAFKLGYACQSCFENLKSALSSDTKCAIQEENS